MSSKASPKEILETMLNVFQFAMEKMTDKNLYFSKSGINQIQLNKKFGEIETINSYDLQTITFETNDLYQFFLIKINEYLPKNVERTFNSYYSVLNFQRIIYYLQKLVKTNLNIVDDYFIKLFFYFLFLYFDSKNIKKRKIDLDEAFFRGTFFELKNKYSQFVLYEDSEEIKNFIKKRKLKMESDLIVLILYTFTNIRESLNKIGDLSDEIMINMNNKVIEILFECDKQNENLSDDLIEKVKKFYEIKEHLVFTNYLSEIKKSQIEKKINSNFLHIIEDQYLSLNFNYTLSDDEDLEIKLHKYLNYKNIYYKRMYLSSLNEIFKWDLNDEVIIFSFSDSDITSRIYDEFEDTINFKNKLKNLNNNKILKIIEDILNEDNFYEIYFSILKCDIIKKIYTSNLYLDENDKEFQLKNEEIKDSECFKDIYINFLNDYDKKSEGYKTFKEIIILKILPGGDRAYTIRYLNKIVINPTQFFLGKDINEKNEDKIKLILKGYLMVIILHETEHYFRLLNKNKKVSDSTPREQEGGRLFIKYLFGVYTINHIDENQANLILNIENWNEHQKIKSNFINKIEDYEKNNINEFILNHFTNSISFFKKESWDIKPQIFPIKK